MNLLTKFHEDRTVNLASRVKNAPLLGSHTRTINVASRVLTRKNAPPLGSHVFKATKTIFHLIQDIIGTNLLTKFHDDRTINVTSREKCATPVTHENRTINQNKEKFPAPGGHVFQPTVIIFELFQDIIGMVLLTKFHEEWTINVASRVLTRFYYSHPCFQAKVTIFELIPDIIGTNILTKFYEDWKINVASRVLTRKNAPTPGGHVFQLTGIIFELPYILGSHVFQAIVLILELIQDIIGTNLLTKFHEDWTINAAF
ncbi:hypothetical protein DPMN_117729 [Dreissena polymorpha]|uniref:Uncharacterized protein n=1 Tax=Dreissena polymorpha TaxID=45954 RepID=A0A9D4JQH6_DREPO|nr:hypothetical protein DPMN_117729 [Dreissena polymorpha]